MHLQIVLLASLLACVCGRYVPNHSQLAQYYRYRRDARPSPQSQNPAERNAHNKQYLYRANDEGYSGDFYVPVEEKRTHSKNPSPSSDVSSQAQKRAYEKSEYKGKTLKNKKNAEKIITKRYSEPAYQHEHEHEHEHYAPPKYGFKYSVHDLEHLDVKHHEEERDGEHTVGEYSVLQPDGTILTVKYVVNGDDGFDAVVSKSDLPKEYEHHFHHKAVA